MRLKSYLFFIRSPKSNLMANTIELESRCIKSHQEGSIQLIDEKPVETVSGYYEYPGAEGKAIRVDYLADKDGFHAKGDAIPQPLPQIQRALDYLATLPPPKEEKYTKA
ncbi:hypothetical protein JTB14_028371 [Gonioctena quinquepunctata]|nr:hypothetical protein JTB14_028371 [Gonioctena quinquepunctata]